MPNKNVVIQQKFPVKSFQFDIKINNCSKNTTVPITLFYRQVIY